VPDELLDELADAYLRLEAFPLAIDVYRLRTQQSRPGSPAWFQARYGQALAYYRAGKGQEARRLIDATAILHPELGGGELRSKFERLRQRLEQD
jgi:predicted Zn-dependent protease